MAFGTLSCIGVVEWSGGTYHPSVRSYGGPGGLGEADLWQSTGVFNVNGGGALAPIVVDEVYRNLSAIRGSGTAILLVEQYVGHALAIADEVAVLAHGSVAYAGPAGELDDIASYLL